MVWYRWLASLVSATFSSQAAVPSSSASVKVSEAPAALRSMSRIRISVIPISSRTAMALFPLASLSDSPLIKLAMAPAASVWNACLNSEALIPATFANCWRDSLPVSTASCMLESRVLNAEPPASASMPTELKAAEKDMICASVMPTWDPAPAIRSPIAVISLSVVAKLFPSATMVEPSF